MQTVECREEPQQVHRIIHGRPINCGIVVTVVTALHEDATCIFRGSLHTWQQLDIAKGVSHGHALHRLDAPIGLTQRAILDNGLAHLLHYHLIYRAGR